MSSGTESPSPDSLGLQFDRAEFEQAAPALVSCAACHRPITETYYEINGTVFCEPCRVAVEGQLRGGSGMARFARAWVFGAGAAVLGTVAYVGTTWATKLNLSIVSIFVGFLIGKAVRAGSRGRGGWPYQVLAVVLTYLAIGATYFSLFILSDPGAVPIDRSISLAMVVFLVIGSVMSPVFFARESVISIAIVGFALWQAWKMNRRLKLVLTGPYRVGDAMPSAPIEGASGHA